MLTTAVANLPPDLKTMLERVSMTGQAECLNVDGKGEWVMLSVEQYKRLVQSAEQSETLADVREGLAQIERGEGRPAEEFFQELENKVRHTELMAAIREGLDQIERGETQPLDECIRELAAKFNLDLAACQR